MICHPEQREGSFLDAVLLLWFLPYLDLWYIVDRCFAKLSMTIGGG